MGGVPGSVGLAGLGWLGTGGVGVVGLAVPGGLGTEGLLGPPGCMMEPGTWAAAVPAKQRPASARVNPLFHVMTCSSPESSGRSPKERRGIDHARSGAREMTTMTREWAAPRVNHVPLRVNATR